MGQLLSAAVLVSFVAGALAFNVAESTPEFTRDTIEIGLVVEDVEETMKFYTDVIGMQRTGGFSIDKDFGKRSGLSGGEPFEVNIMKVKDSPASTELKIVGFPNSTKAKDSDHIQDRIGLQYITIYVESLDPHLEKIRAHKIKLLGDTPISLPDGRRFLMVRDPNGVFVELIGN